MAKGLRMEYFRNSRLIGNQFSTFLYLINQPAIFSALGTESRVSHMLGECSPTKSHSQSSFFFLTYSFEYLKKACHSFHLKVLN